MKKKIFKRFVCTLLTVLSLLSLFPTIPTVAEEPEIMPLADADFEQVTVYVCNAKHLNFMQVDNNAAYNEEGAKMELWDFGGTTVQQWKFTHIGYSYYKIQNISSGQYLAIPSGANKPVQKSTYVNDMTMNWLVELMDGWKYKITCQATEKTLRGNTVFGTNGQNVVQDEYDADSNYCDEWYLYSIHNYTYLTLPTKAYYDPYSNYSAADLQWYYEQAANKMMSKFHIRFSTPTIESSNDLVCPSSCDANFPNEVCTSNCGSFSSCSSTHHRSSVRLLSLLRSSGIYVCRFTSYDLCKWKNNSHVIIYGTAERGGKDSIVSTSGSEDLYYLIQHELTHNLGTYDDAETGGCSSGACVMKGQAGYWCDNCLAIIRENY